MSYSGGFFILRSAACGTELRAAVCGTELRTAACGLTTGYGLRITYGLRTTADVFDRLPFSFGIRSPQVIRRPKSAVSPQTAVRSSVPQTEVRRIRRPESEVLYRRPKSGNAKSGESFALAAPPSAKCNYAWTVVALSSVIVIRPPEGTHPS